MAGVGSSEMQALRHEFNQLSARVVVCLDRIADLQRQVAGLQSALRGGDVVAAGGKPRPPTGGELSAGGARSAEPGRKRGK
jgi:hypothetical protein